MCVCVCVCVCVSGSSVAGNKAKNRKDLMWWPHSMYKFHKFSISFSQTCKNIRPMKMRMQVNTIKYITCKMCSGFQSSTSDTSTKPLAHTNSHSVNTTHHTSHKRGDTQPINGCTGHMEYIWGLTYDVCIHSGSLRCICSTT